MYFLFKINGYRNQETKLTFIDRANVKQIKLHCALYIISYNVSKVSLEFYFVKVYDKN